MNNYSLRDPLYIRPDFFIFRDPISRLPFTTHICDSHSRPTFATPFRDSHSRPTFATHFRDSCLRLHSRLHFTTRIHDHTRDSRSRLLIALPTATCYFLSRLPSCDSTTDGRTVLTPQCHLPSVPTQTLQQQQKLFGTYSLAWPPPLAPTHHHVHPPSGLVSPDMPFGPTPPPPPEASTPPARPQTSIPTFITPPEPPSIPLYGSMSLMF